MFQKMFKGKETVAAFSALAILGAVSLPLAFINDRSTPTVKHNKKVAANEKKVNACEIDIANKGTIIVKDKKAANRLLKDVKEMLIDRFNLKEKGASAVVFKDAISFKKMRVKSEKVDDIREAKKYFTSYEMVLYNYTIQDGDTFWDISSKKDISVTKLLKLNPQHIKSLKNGDVIKLYRMVPRISLQWEETFDGNEKIPFSTVKENTAKLFKGNTVITQRGKNGIKKIEAVISKLDGQEVGRRVIKSTLVKNPTVQHQLVGTSIKPPTFSSGIFRMPVFGSVSSRFGVRWGRRHTGVDLSAHYGQAIKATDGGRVIFAGWYSGYGKLVKIDHENGYVTYYGHCSELKVSEGERVYAGQLIALVGSTGHSTGPHLHFEVRKNGVPVNPLAYISK